MMDTYPDSARDTRLVIDVEEFYRCLDIVREGFKRMVNNHDFRTQTVPTIQAAISVMDTEASVRRESVEIARQILGQEPTA